MINVREIQVKHASIELTIKNTKLTNDGVFYIKKDSALNTE